MDKKSADNKYLGSVKVGQKGQIVIPKEVREMFGISPGDTLIILADTQKGIALERYEFFAKIADAILEGKAQAINPENLEDESLNFANAIKEEIKEREGAD